MITYTTLCMTYSFLFFNFLLQRRHRIRATSKTKARIEKMTANAITRPEVFAPPEARDDPVGYTMFFPNGCTSVTSRSLHALSANND